ncbi:hypothetical protein [Streptomyces sp. NPDC059009]|uniref:hypothetical protein n=1 Tax=Streptomyces sp. NPDC059009 TaxID=3346694 RepID=UPI00367A3857
MLVGDAGYCAAPTAGMGTSQALIGARSLARHLAASDGDHAAASTAYETELRPYVAANQQTGREGAAAFGAATCREAAPRGGSAPRRPHFLRASANWGTTLSRA